SITLGITDAFKSQTLAELAARADEQRARDLPAVAPIQRRATQTAAPLSYAQQRLWFIDRLSGGSRQYNITLPVKIHGRLDMDALVAALDAIVRRHEVLRTTYHEHADGSVLQRIQPCAPLALSGYRDLRGCALDEQRTRLDEQLRAAADIN
ncbi:MULTISPECIES: condensation domain-containing protein, partial [unclassified Xanthomonas]|uniref:condensation domain-containing protein n=1 Tax=unclassified Xanthomonas TaxID=2643310 RepID=UPI002A7EECBD